MTYSATAQGVGAAVTERERKPGCERKNGPRAPRYTSRNLHYAAILPCGCISPVIGRSHDQVSFLDFIIDEGKIAAILPGGSEPQAPVFDADGGQGLAALC